MGRRLPPIPAETVFGRLRVVDEGFKNKRGEWCYACNCQCGNVTVVPASRLYAGHTKSCGCYRAEDAGKRFRVHGGCLGNKRSPEHVSWSHMQARCLRATCPEYPYYGGRGIKICDRWLESFQNFIDDMGLKPSPQHSLDRINNSDDYTPENCRWATKKEQANNRRSNLYLGYLGLVLSATEWADRLGVSASNICARKRRGWSDEDALFGKGVQ